MPQHTLFSFFHRNKDNSGTICGPVRATNVMKVLKLRWETERMETTAHTNQENSSCLPASSLK